MIFSLLLVILIGCGSEAPPERRGTTKNIKIAAKLFRHPDAALAFIRKHPAIKSRGLFSNTFAAELDLHPNVWGRYVNSDSSLETRKVNVDGKLERLIFAKGFTPEEQIAHYLNDLNPEVFKKGLPITPVGEHVQFKQDDWSRAGFHRAISHYIDKKKYVTRLANVDGKHEKLIFAKGFTPEEQIAHYLNDLNPEVFKKGLPIAQVDEHVQFKQDGWSRAGFHNAISHYIDKKKYVTHQVNVDGKPEMLIFAKGFTPKEQIAHYLNDLNPEVFKKGLPIAQVDEHVQFKQDGMSRAGFHRAIGRHIDRKKYVTRLVNVDGKHEKLIFAK